MAALLLKILTFLGPVAGAVKGVINLAEIKRVLTGSAVVGAFVSFATAVGTALLGDVSNIFPNMLIAGLAAKGLTAMIDLFRRLNQGK